MTIVEVRFTGCPVYEKVGHRRYYFKTAQCSYKRDGVQNLLSATQRTRMDCLDLIRLSLPKDHVMFVRDHVGK